MYFVYYKIKISVKTQISFNIYTFMMRMSQNITKRQKTQYCSTLCCWLDLSIIMFGRRSPKIFYTWSSRRALHRGCAIMRAPARGCRTRVMPCATRARPPVRWKMRRSPAPAQGARPRRRAAVRRYVVCKPTTSTVAPVATAR